MICRVTIILFALLLAGCQGKPAAGTPPDSGVLRVSAAASLKDAFTEIAKLYEEKTGRRVVFNFGASGALQKQIENGAPADVFASAGEMQMRQLSEKGLLDESSRRFFAGNTLRLIVPRDSEFTGIAVDDLLKPAIKRIAIGNPKTVPAGFYAEEMLKYLGYQDRVKNKLIFAEDVRQVLEYVRRGEVDAGIVYQSDVYPAFDDFHIGVLPENTYPPIVYPVAVLRDAEQKEGARQFIDLLFDAHARLFLNKHGFASVDGQ